MSKKPPSKFRRLTKQEAEKIGVSYSSKHAVDASIPKGAVTKRNKIYSNRQAYQLTTKVVEDEHGHVFVKSRGSKEAYTKSRQYKDDYSIRYLNVKPEDLPRILKRAEGHTTQILAYGNDGQTKYGVNPSMKFAATPMIAKGELKEHLDRMGFELDEGEESEDEFSGRGLLGFSSENPPARVDIRIRLFSKSDLTPEQIDRMKAKHKGKRK